MSDIPRFHAVGRGKIAAIATTLEMRRRPELRPVPPGVPAEIMQMQKPDPDAYLRLYRKVGAPHLWFSRLVMTREELAQVLSRDETCVVAYRVGSESEGILELDFSRADECEIKYFGVTAPLQGSGAGRRLMNHAIETAFERGVSRLWLHTNTIDHPKAMPFYIRSGFMPVRQEVEIADDPRLQGLLPRDAAPHVPIFE